MVRKIIQKLSLVIAIIIFVLFLAETILYVSGRIYFWYRIKNVSIASKNENAVKILCLGDSFTFGMGADKGYSYPEQLEKMLNEKNLNNKKYIVFNRGRPGNTSSKLLNHLEEELQIYNPDILIVLIGMNDRDTLEETNYFLFKHKSIINKLVYYLNNSKVYKLFKGVKDAWEVNLWKNKLLVTYGSNHIFESLKTKDMESLYTNVERLQEARKHNALGWEHLKDSNIEISLAIEEFQKAIEIMPNDKEGYKNLGWVFIKRDKDDLGVNQLKKAMEIDPYDQGIWMGLWLAYYKMGEKSLAEESLKRYLYLNPSDVQKYLLFLKYGLPNKEDDRVFGNLLYFNLQKIIDIAKERKVSVFFQKYPYECMEVDLITNVVTQKNKVYLIEQSFTFERLSLQKDYRYLDYFVEDSHCNNKGYSVMAENVYSVLSSVFMGSGGNSRK